MFCNIQQPFIPSSCDGVLQVKGPKTHVLRGARSEIANSAKDLIEQSLAWLGVAPID